MNYEDTIAQLVTKHLNLEFPSMEPLTVALGCSVIERNGKTGAWFRLESPQPDVRHEALVCDTLKQALQHHMGHLVASYHGLALLDGLVKNDRWRLFIANADDAYALATLLVYCTESMFRTVNEPFLPILNGWLMPETPLTDYPGVLALSELFFGSAWRHVVLENGGFRWSEIPHLIKVSRPPFLPGLVATADTALEQPLPPLS